MSASPTTTAGADQVPTAAARTGRDYLDGLASAPREIWLNGERLTNPLEHPQLRSSAEAVAALYDLQQTQPEKLLAADPDAGRPVNVTHLIPRSRDDLERRRRAIEAMAALSAGLLSCAPDQVNVAFASFAGMAEVFARRGNEDRAEKLVAYHRLLRGRDLALSQALVNPQVDRAGPHAAGATAETRLHKIGETHDGIVVRGARLLTTLAPLADEVTVYSTRPVPAQDNRAALLFSVPVGTPGVRFICRDSYARRGRFDFPLSSRFDELDAAVIFDDVEIPNERVFVDADAQTYNEVLSDGAWRGHMAHRAMARASVKLTFALGLGHLLASTNGLVRLDHIQEKLGEIANMVELTRAAVIASEACSAVDDHGVCCPDARPLLALTGEMPRWMPRANEILQLVGGAGFMATPSQADLESPIRGDIDRFFQGLGAEAEERIRLFRLAWDFVGSELGARAELHERFHLDGSWRNRVLAYHLADKQFPIDLVASLLDDTETQARAGA